MPNTAPLPANNTSPAAAGHGLHVFADGCFDPVSRQGGWAFVACCDAVEIAADCGGVEDAASNAMEAVALLKASAWINGNAQGRPAIIWSDSLYTVKGCNVWLPIWKNNGWKKIGANKNVRGRTISNADIWKAIGHELSQNQLITISWCKGHAAIAGNERADELAEHGRLLMSKGKRP